MGLLGWVRPVIYISVHPETLRIRHVQTGRCVAERPVAARNQQGKYLAAGTEAELLAQRSEGLSLTNPFRHPRLVISDFESAAFIVKDLARRLFRYRLVMTAPRAVLHLQFNPRGGFTQMETRAIVEMVIGIGIRHITVWHGQVPTDEELLSLEFRSGGQTLSY